MTIRVRRIEIVCDYEGCNSRMFDNLAGADKAKLRRSAKRFGWIRQPKKNGEPGGDFCRRHTAGAR